jgi:DNA-binding SARP family transcriptional activator
MNNTVFVRPNLKVFLLGAVLLLVVQHLISSVHSQGPASRPLPANARQLSDADLQELVREAATKPTSAAYTRISRLYEQRGDHKKAILYLRRAEKLSQMEEASE